MGKPVETMECPRCGKQKLGEREFAKTVPFRGEQFTIRVKCMRCDECAFESFTPKQLDLHLRIVADEYRKRHGLLQSDEIRSLRLKLGWSQADAARYLGVGIASLKRWEGAQVQDIAMDRLMRVCMDPEEARKNLDKIAIRRITQSPLVNENLEFGAVESRSAYAAFKIEPKDYVTSDKTFWGA